ncbi:MAG: GNAT family N-acetyltransferase [Firmicutes bacterium]|nr:GNAT family N-acetyltransferase [Bacillota bacterium]
MKIIISTKEHVPLIMKLIDNARVVMKEMGIDQWQNAPDGSNAVLNESIILDDIKNGNSYLVVDGDKILGHGTLVFGDDSTYEIITNGSWQSNEPYGTIHRVATEKNTKQKGIASHLLSVFEEIAVLKKVNYLRIDTHKDNTPMLNLVSKN